MEIMFGSLRVKDWRRVATPYDRCPTVPSLPSRSPQPSTSDCDQRDLTLGSESTCQIRGLFTTFDLAARIDTSNEVLLIKRAIDGYTSNVVLQNTWKKCLHLDIHKVI